MFCIVSMIFIHVHILLMNQVCVHSVVTKLYGMSVPKRKVIKQIYSDVFCVHVVFSMDKLPCDKDLHSKVFWCHEILYSLSQYFSNFPKNFMLYNRQPRNLHALQSSIVHYHTQRNLPLNPAEKLLLISNHTYKNVLHVS